MLEIFLGGGVLMYPLALCSAIALAIILERLWTLRLESVAPANLVYEVWQLIETNQISGEKMNLLKRKYPLGAVLASGLSSSKFGRMVMDEQMQATAVQKIHRLKRFTNMLGTIAMIAPLLGLLGTVVGMIEIFVSFQATASASAGFIARGISQALITTAFGLAIAIPAVAFHRFLLRRLDDIAVEMEHQASILLNMMFRSSAKR
ncbi:MAG: MotA/TolQ/ExbB proton channel family protein [Gammaproteobacteria bacterium]|nr:MotA/TolQ/ExbB proton channel family protein [Gammaproteobacteria bacterium]